MNLNDNNNFVGNAQECLNEAHKLDYAYFSPELDNFGEKVTVADIWFRVAREMDNLDGGDLEDHALDSKYKWNTNRNKAW